jgi:hypothetical protein
MYLCSTALGRLGRLSLVFAAILIALTGASASAQIAGTGTIQGSVTDPSGAFIPSATVTLTEEATKVTRVAHTDRDGAYVFPNIPVGTYTVSVASQGFQTYAKTHNVLEVGSNIDVDAKMPIGQAEQTVTVEAEGDQRAPRPRPQRHQPAADCRRHHPRARRRLHRLQVQLRHHLCLRGRRQWQHHPLAPRWR